MFCAAAAECCRGVSIFVLPLRLCISTSFIIRSRHYIHHFIKIKPSNGFGGDRLYLLFSTALARWRSASAAACPYINTAVPCLTACLIFKLVYQKISINLVIACADSNRVINWPQWDKSAAAFRNWKRAARCYADINFSTSANIISMDLSSPFMYLRCNIA